MIRELADHAYHVIHRNGFLANLAYKTWCTIYNVKEILTPPSKYQKVNPETGLYDILGLNISTTAICNSRCRFCVYKRLEDVKEVMSDMLFHDILAAWKNFGGNPDRAVNLTPGTPPGECLTDPGFDRKLKIVTKFGYKTFFVTNGILLHKWTDTILNPEFGVEGISISVPSFDPDVYKEVFGVDKGNQVYTNIIHFLDENKKRGWPVKTMICFRNAESPAKIIAHPRYRELERYFGPNSHAMFTTWWDDWNGGVPKDEMEYGWIKTRKPLNLNRVCQGSLLFSMRPGDRKIRFCGCRFVEGQEDQIVGDLDNGGFFKAQEYLFSIQEGFKIGRRVKTCQNCGAYKQA